MTIGDDNRVSAAPATRDPRKQSKAIELESAEAKNRANPGARDFAAYKGDANRTPKDPTGAPA
jgi:hypothetical protein